MVYKYNKKEYAALGGVPCFTHEELLELLLLLDDELEDELLLLDDGNGV